MAAQSHHGVADARTLDTRAHRAHHARDLGAGHERQRRLHLVEAAHHERVGKVERGRAHLDQHLVLFRRGIGMLADGERLGTVEARAHHRPHEGSARIMSLTRPRWCSALPNVASIIVSRLNQWLTTSSSVMPMAPCSWIACWPTRRAACPTKAFAELTRRARSAASAPDIAAAARMAMERASTALMVMSAMRCWSAWKRPIGWPNCLRVFRYSSVASLSASMMPIASAHNAALPRSSERSMKPRAWPSAPILMSWPTSRP